MLSFAAPAYLFASLAAAAGLIAAHFIVRRQPRAMVLPTARFVPDAPVLTTGWARKPSDLTLLALRVLCVVLAGLALAGPFLRRTGGGVARVVVADRSRAVADTGEVSDSVASVIAPGDVVIDSRESLSAGLVAAVRAAARFREAADSVELVIVSSFALEQMDAATARVRAEWPGRARLVNVAPATSPESLRAPVLSTPVSDPFAVAVRLARPLLRGDARFVRGTLSQADSSWVAEGGGRVVIHWPDAAQPAGFLRMSSPVSTGAVATARSAVVAPFTREWRYLPAAGTTPVAWWIDGEVAAAELPLGAGCVKSVAIPVTAIGDFVLRPDFHALLRDIVEPCGGAPSWNRSPGAVLATLAGPGALAPAGAFAKPPAAVSRLSVWLLIASLLCALVELLLRRPPRTRRAGTRADSATAERKAA